MLQQNGNLGFYERVFRGVYVEEAVFIHTSLSFPWLIVFLLTPRFVTVGLITGWTWNSQTYDWVSFSQWVRWVRLRVKHCKTLPSGVLALRTHNIWVQFGSANSLCLRLMACWCYAEIYSAEHVCDLPRACQLSGVGYCLRGTPDWVIEIIARLSYRTLYKSSHWNSLVSRLLGLQGRLLTHVPLFVGWHN